jgi:hypothetical protein
MCSQFRATEMDNSYGNCYVVADSLNAVMTELGVLKTVLWA